MKYPRIFSISTVGLRRHYNQDYLFHPERTDFIGGNGVGKSIIADILQLIFITDKELIKFGTDGLKNKLREPYSLPYKCNEAYAFLNIEVTEGNFICIGVCIPNSNTRRIIPFVITKTADITGELSENSFKRENILTCKHFLNNGAIPSLPDLSKHLRSSYNLYLKNFTYKPDKQEYYRFLYTKQILPINLCIEANLHAFAKIIQSFSKAKAIDLDDSESLKRFLFDDSELEYEITFEKHKDELNKLMIDFKELEAQINDIENKQSALNGLKEKESRLASSEFEYKKGEIVLLQAQKVESEEAYKKAQKNFDNNVTRRAELEKRAKKLDALKIRASKELELTQDTIKALKEYSEVLIGIKGIQEQIKSLENSEQVNIPDTIKIYLDIQISTLEASDILGRIRFVKPLFNKYTSLYSMEQKVKEQFGVIEGHHQKFSSEINELKHLLDLLNYKKKGTLFEQVIKEKLELTEGQEAILFSLLDVNWNKPAKISSNIRYVTSIKVLDSTNIEEDKNNNGYWLALGEIKEFIPKRNEQRLFDKVERLKEVLEDRKSEIKSMISGNELKLVELENLRLKRPYDMDKLAIDYNFDNALLDGTALEYIKVSSVIIQRKNEKIIGLKGNIKEAEKKLDAINMKYSVTINGDEIEKQIKAKEEEEKIKKLRKESIEKMNSDEKIELGILINGSGQGQDNVQVKSDDYNNSCRTYSEKESAFFETYPDIDRNSLFEKKYTQPQLEELRNLREGANTDYITEYKSIVQQFEETKENRDPVVKEQLDNKTYGFTILERTLLGSKISHLDKITPYLEGANTERMRMMGTLHETMMKVFSNTATKYKSFEGTIKNLNTFFKGKKISNHYYFKVNFEPNSNFSIDWIEQLKSHGRQVFRQGELPFGDSVETFIESFFKRATGNTKTIYLADLLNPKTYFTLSVSLTDENNNEIPGSTGETYSSILLLGIGRLSKVQDENRPGIRFMILEETANLDPTNFNTFPNIAEEFGYQLITMTPRPYGSDEGKEWYVHHLIKGIKNPDINYPFVSSYYRTNTRKEDLISYLKAKEVA